jgi:hypothetical protein
MKVFISSVRLKFSLRLRACVMPDGAHTGFRNKYYPIQNPKSKIQNGTTHSRRPYPSLHRYREACSTLPQFRIYRSHHNHNNIGKISAFSAHNLPASGGFHLPFTLFNLKSLAFLPLASAKPSRRRVASAVFISSVRLKFSLRLRACVKLEVANRG